MKTILIRWGLQGIFFLLSPVPILCYAGEPAKVLHATLESSRTFNEYTRKSKSEYWIDHDHLYRARNQSIMILRNDLKLQWIIDTVQKTYFEYSLEKERQPRQKEDMHTVGENYDPIFYWVQTGLGHQNINGFDCEGIQLDGDADFAETRIRLWICTLPDLAFSGQMNDFMLNSLQNSDEMKKVVVTLKKYRHPLLVRMEEICEEPISSKISLILTVTGAENIVPPAGIFDLPGNLKKQENN